MREAKESRASSSRLVAAMLADSCRNSAPSLSLDHLEQVTPLLLKMGAGGLAWRVIRNSDLGNSQVAELFQAAYRMQALQAALHERNLRRIIPVLRAAGVEPLLVKGWAIARLYPEPAMRPYCDLDICVMPDDYPRAEAALKTSEYQGCAVDLHSGFGKFYDRRPDAVFARSRLVKLGELDVRVLGPEDDLRFLCMHLLRHGAMLPLWLCDISVLLERCRDDFDWDLCLSGSRRQADWVACAIGLAHQILGSNIEGTPVAGRARNLPGWLLPAVLNQWGLPPHSRVQIAPLLSHPARIVRELVRELPHHWPNPIEASVAVGAPFNGAPRLPFQIGHCFSRAVSVLMVLLGQRRIQHKV